MWSLPPNDNYAALALAGDSTRYSCPEDFQVIGYDGTQSVQLSMPELATVVQPIEAMRSVPAGAH